jgi:glycosyltransferase involved in cell wall biosynthesis
MSRAIAKFLWAIFYGIRYQPDLYMGYHIFPAALSALAVARILNRPACYQVTSGQTELEEGGWQAENRLLGALGGPSATIGKMASAVVSEFDLVVVRGSGAKAYIRAIGYKRQLAIITGSADIPIDFLTHAKRDIDVVFVGRLTACKQPERFVSVMREIAQFRTTLKAVMIGDGPNEKELKSQIARASLQGNVKLLGKRKDVAAMLARSKVFVLTSRSEGLSIAMIEAMMSGVVPVVADVGDLKDFIQNGTNGYLITGDDIATFTRHIVSLLDDPVLWQKCSKKAIRTVKSCSSIDAISSKWRDEFNTLMEQRKA